MMDSRKRPDEFLEQVRDLRRRRHQDPLPPLNPALVDQMAAASRDARRIMDEGIVDVVVDVDEIGEREEALAVALAAAPDRRGLVSPYGLASPRPELMDLVTGEARRCDVCDAYAIRLELMQAQYGPYIFQARVCVRCRRFAPDAD